MGLPGIQALLQRALGNPGDAASAAANSSAHAKLQQLLAQADVLTSTRLGSIKSIQLVSLSNPLSGTNNITITSVNTAKAFAILNGMGSSSGTMVGCSGLTSATNVQVNYNNATPLVTVLVVEFN